jgi:hypothetical protein
LLLHKITKIENTYAGETTCEDIKILTSSLSGGNGTKSHNAEEELCHDDEICQVVNDE